MQSSVVRRLLDIARAVTAALITIHNSCPKSETDAAGLSLKAR